MKKKSASSSAFLNLRSLIYVAAACSILTGTLLAYFRADNSSKVFQKALTFAERVAYQRAIEDVYWRHRIWPEANPGRKPSLDKVTSQAQLEEKVKDYLRNSQTLEDYWHQPITPKQLQAEMDRICHNTRRPEVLREIFAALANDPAIIAECLARPVLAERLVRDLHPRDGSANDRKQNGATAVSNAVSDDQRVYYAAAVPAQYTLPAITSAPNGCDDTWTPTDVPVGVTPRYSHTAVWTGTEMIIWGGNNGPSYPPEGGRYNPTTDSWSATSTTNAPVPRSLHTAVWTGTEMLVWGGHDPTTNMPTNTGGRYNPATDTWIPTNTSIWVRENHTAIWTGTEMIEWGGYDPVEGSTNTGARYNPAMDSWTPTSIPPIEIDARYLHTAVWSGSEMIVWGGDSNGHGLLNTGGRYNPATDTWTATDFNNAPDPRIYHTAVWTGSELIIWGGYDEFSYFNTGGRYNPATNSWVATNTTNAPDARYIHTAVWTGSEMIIWGGGNTSLLNTGGRYDPGTNSWTDTSTTNAPDPRSGHTAVWAGSEMIVWGGIDPAGHGLNTGGRYCGQTGPTPTPTPTATPTPTPTPCTGRCNPTPRPRPTPHRRPTPH